MVFCKNCKCLEEIRGYDLRKFYDITYEEDLKQPVHFKPEYPFNYYRICQHPSCFSTTTRITPEEKVVNRVRIQGQAQLNRYNNCALFKAKENEDLRSSLSPPPTPPLCRSIVEGQDPRVTILDSENSIKKNSWYKFWEGR